MNLPPESGSLRALLAVNGFKSRLFRSLGSKPVELRWDVFKKTVSVKAIGANDTPIETIFEVQVKEIERVFILNGNYILTVNGQTYDMEIQHYKGQRAIVHDLLGAEIGGLASAYADAKGSGEHFIRFIQQELPPQLMAVSILKSRTRIKVAILIAILVVVGLVVFGIQGAQR